MGKKREITINKKTKENQSSNELSENDLYRHHRQEDDKNELTNTKKKSYKVKLII